MCRFKSGIIFKDKVVVAPGENDSHEDLLKSLGIEDNYVNSTKMFVRVILIPDSNEWWISPKKYPEKWQFSVDQDNVPDWFERKEAEKRFRVAVCEWWSDHVLVDQKIEKLNSGFYRLKGCTVEELCGDVRIYCNNCHIDEMIDSSRVLEMCGDSRINDMCNNSSINEMYDNSNVSRMSGNSSINEMYDNSNVSRMDDNSHINEMYDNSNVSRMDDNSHINEMRGNSHVSRMDDNSHINEMYENSYIISMCDNSQVLEMYDNSMARDFKKYPNIKILVSKDTNIEVTVFK